MDYSELVKALRLIGKEQDCNECEAGRWHHDFKCCLFEDAAAAIEALEKALIEENEASDDFYRISCEKQSKIEELQDEVKDLKRVNMEIFEDLPKRGEWIESEEEEWGIYPFKKKTCSVCDCKIDHTFMLACMDYFDDRGTVFHYCPNCGARMDGGKDDRS